MTTVQQWRLEGYDTFSGEEYPLDGDYGSYADALRAARHRLAALNHLQPDAGGQACSGIQDRVYIVHPDGRKERVSS